MLALILPVVVGVITGFWVHLVGPQCGYNGPPQDAHLSRVPVFPGLLAFLVLVVPSALLTGASALLQRRSTRAVAGFTLAVAIASFVAFVAAQFQYAVSYGCFS